MITQCFKPKYPVVPPIDRNQSYASMIGGERGTVHNSCTHLIFLQSDRRSANSYHCLPFPLICSHCRPPLGWNYYITLSPQPSPGTVSWIGKCHQSLPSTLGLAENGWNFPFGWTIPLHSRIIVSATCPLRNSGRRLNQLLEHIL